MDPRPAYSSPSAAAPLSSRARLERISEPWSLNRSVSIIGTFVLAMVLGSWAANGEVENIILFGVLIAAVLIIVFVHDYWWSAPLVISALDFGATIAGFPFGGMQIGVVILGLTFPIKLAMKTLRKAEPEMGAGLFFWLVFVYVAVHCVVIISYNKIEGTLILRNIFKNYFNDVTPLIIFGLLMRYCRLHTVRPTVIVLFYTILFTVLVSSVVLLSGVVINPFTDLRIIIGWLDSSSGAMVVLRDSGPWLFIGSLAFMPVFTSHWGRFITRFGLLVATFGVLVGSGRLPLVICLAAGLFFAIVRGKLWLALPVIVITILTSVTLTVSPDLVNSLPTLIQRSVTPLIFSDQGAQMKEDLEASDDWHRDLRNRSLIYWTQDTNSFWFGHGYKPWDYSMNSGDGADATDMDHLADIAVEMGATENTFSSITNIFGLTGLILYGCFLGSVALSLYKGCRLAPAGSFTRALCEFSLINLLAIVVLCPFMGTVPNFEMIFYQLGILGARPYLARKTPALAPVVPAFARPAFATHDESRRFRRSRA